MKLKNSFSPTRIIAGGFLAAILAGTGLLLLPLAAAEGVETTPLDALFTATSAVCVTGLAVVPTAEHWSWFGQLVLLLLFEIGGLGTVTFTMAFLMAAGRRAGLRDRMLIRDAYNLSTIRGVTDMVKKVLLGTLAAEAVGVLFFLPSFCRDFGPAGIWKSIFQSVSAFCNAGMDVLAPEGMILYADDPLVCFGTMMLIILGGLGFPVWWILRDYFYPGGKRRGAMAVNKRRMPLYAKVVLWMTGGLLLSGMLITLALEWSNPSTLGPMPVPEKLMAALFQSVTLRTAGFSTISQAGLRKSTCLAGCVLMFIGGSPSGTAGGVKTTTAMILGASVLSMLRERNDTELFKRKVGDNTVRRALAICAVSFSVMILSLFAMCIMQPGSLLDCLYEVVSAIGTVGLSRDLTPRLIPAGKWIIILTMYIGRIGPISLAVFFNTRKFVNLITYPEERISVG